MTVVALCSVKGSPGVTTTACLLGAAWPGSGRVVLVEADPSGGDCAARFGLSARVGWTSLSAATRRGGAPLVLESHLQVLPGGLPVLVGARGDERRSPASDEGMVVRPDGAAGSRPDPGLTLVDLGRWTADDPVTQAWMEIADTTLVLVRGDRASAVTLRDRCDRLLAQSGDRLGLVSVGGSYSATDLARFAGMQPFGELPDDPAAAAVATGSSTGGRRLERSPLWLAVGRLAAAIPEGQDDPALIGTEHRADGATGWAGTDAPDGLRLAPEPRQASIEGRSERVLTRLARLARIGRRLPVSGSVDG